MSSQLAQELVDAIVDEVPKQSLGECSLISKAFLVPSQRRLFQSLSLFSGRLLIPGPPKGQQILLQFEKACDMFAMAPHLAGYVRSLVLCVTPSQTYAAVEAVLRQLSQAKLVFLSILANAYSFDWEEMPASVTSLVKNLIVHPTFRSISFTRIARVPRSLVIHAASSLPVLSFCQSSLIDEAGSETASFIPRGSPAANLHELNITIRDYPVFPAKSVLDIDLNQYLCGLRILTLSVHATADAGWARILLESDAHNTLRYVEISFQSPLPVLDFPFFPALRVLDVGFKVPNQTLPQNLDHLLANLASFAPHIESLYLSAETVSVVRSVWRGDRAPYPPFASRDFEEKLPRLKKLHWCRNTGNAVNDDFEEYVGAKCPGPLEAGILTFDTSGH
ncbi:hypothetical protein B0H11DRAFT_978255 [Mycena galericulata]|nr:hypothetical protein B0H11DRAFT_978255 [Mycena galericulata]